MGIAAMIDRAQTSRDPEPSAAVILNGEIKRRTEVVGIVPNEAGIKRLVGAGSSRTMNGPSSARAA